MTKIIRPDADVLAFGSQAQSGERTVFGNESLVSDDLTDNLNADYFRGWFAGLDPVNGFPPMEYFNGQIFTTSQLISYFFQMGTPEWNINQFYPKNARSIDSAGIEWKALQDNTGQAQVEGAYWTDVTTVIIPDASTTVKGIVELATGAEAAAGTDTERAIVPSTLRSGLNAIGSAPIYGARTWGNVNGTGVVSIRASGNVSSITDNGTGNYTINLIVAMPDADYTVAPSANNTYGLALNEDSAISVTNYTTTSFDIRALNSSVGLDPLELTFAVVR